MILGLVRSLVVLAVTSVVVIVVVDRLQSDDAGSGSHSVTVAFTIIGAIALAQLVRAVLRRHGSSWRGVGRLWLPADARPTVGTVPTVRELEALIIAATTGGPRARDRLDRRLDRVGCGTLADHLSTSEPTPSQVTDAVDRLLTDAEERHDL